MTTGSNKAMTGIYIHIPFCKSKCPYCDFYSFSPNATDRDSYLKAVLLCLMSYKDKIKDSIDTVYFGGGTPSFFGGERIQKVIDCIKDNYNVTGNAEITVECNPSSVDGALAHCLKKAGVNRISMGMQSAVERERKKLGRLSDRNQLENAVRLFRESGIDNISLDLMLGIPCQTRQSLKQSLDFILSQGVKHVSAYMLKIEENTPFSKAELTLPDEDEVCELYLYAAEYLEEKGYEQYEISNFALSGFESRHNLKYWHCEEYLGIGPSAHSFIGGERFYYPRDFGAFLKNPLPVSDGSGGDRDEYIMLSLRLREGLTKEGFEKRFGEKIPEGIFEKARRLEKAELLSITEKGISLTKKGFLLSNSIITDLLRS